MHGHTSGVRSIAGTGAMFLMLILFFSHLSVIDSLESNEMLDSNEKAYDSETHQMKTMGRQTDLCTLLSGARPELHCSGWGIQFELSGLLGSLSTSQHAHSLSSRIRKAPEVKGKLIRQFVIGFRHASFSFS